MRVLRPPFSPRFWGLSFAALRIPFILVLDQKNGRFLASSYIMMEDDFTVRAEAPAAAGKAEEVTAAGRTQFEKMVLLRRWVRHQWNSGPAFFYPPWTPWKSSISPVDTRPRILRAVLRGLLQGLSGHGMHARYVELPDHFPRRLVG